METPLSFNLIWCFSDGTSGDPIMLEVRIHTGGYCRVSLDAIHHRIRIEEADENYEPHPKRQTSGVCNNV